MSAEIWLDVAGYEGLYAVSNHGRIRSLRNNIYLRPATSHGYEHVTLVDADGSRKNLRIHVIVLTAFCGPAPFTGAHAAHNDGVKTNNRLTNLRWASATENQADIARHGRRRRGVEIYGAKLNDNAVRAIRNRLLRGEQYPTIADDFEVSISTISLISRDKIWRHVQ